MFYYRTCRRAGLVHVVRSAGQAAELKQGDCHIDVGIEMISLALGRLREKPIRPLVGCPTSSNDRGQFQRSLLDAAEVKITKEVYARECCLERHVATVSLPVKPQEYIALVKE